MHVCVYMRTLRRVREQNLTRHAPLSLPVREQRASVKHVAVKAAATHTQSNLNAASYTAVQ
jgi:hypothetical protein